MIRCSIHIEVVPLMEKQETKNKNKQQQQTNKKQLKQKQNKTIITKKQQTNKLTSMEIKLELSQWHLSASPYAFPAFLKNNIHPINTTCPTLSKYSRSRLISSVSKAHWTISELFPMFWNICQTSFTSLSRPTRILCYHWSVKQQCLKLSHR